MRTWLALCALFAASLAASIGPHLDSDVDGRQHRTRHVRFFESQRISRGNTPRPPTTFSTTSNFGGKRRLSAADSAPPGASGTDSSETGSEDAVASLINRFGGSLQEKRRLEDSDEDSSEEEVDQSSPGAPTRPSLRTTSSTSGEDVSFRSAPALAQVEHLGANAGAVLLRTGIKQVKLRTRPYHLRGTQAGANTFFAPVETVKYASSSNSDSPASITVKYNIRTLGPPQAVLSNVETDSVVSDKGTRHDDCKNETVKTLSVNEYVVGPGSLGQPGVSIADGEKTIADAQAQIQTQGILNTQSISQQTSQGGVGVQVAPLSINAEAPAHTGGERKVGTGIPAPASANDQRLYLVGSGGSEGTSEATNSPAIPVISSKGEFSVEVADADRANAPLDGKITSGVTRYLIGQGESGPLAGNGGSSTGATFHYSSLSSDGQEGQKEPSGETAFLTGQVVSSSLVGNDASRNSAVLSHASAGVQVDRKDASDVTHSPSGGLSTTLADTEERTKGAVLNYGFAPEGSQGSQKTVSGVAAPPSGQEVYPSLAGSGGNGKGDVLDHGAVAVGVQTDERRPDVSSSLSEHEATSTPASSEGVTKSAVLGYDAAPDGVKADAKVSTDVTASLYGQRVPPSSETIQGNGKGSVQNYGSAPIFVQQEKVDSEGTASLSGQGGPFTVAGAEGGAKSVVYSYNSALDGVQEGGKITTATTSTINEQGASTALEGIGGSGKGTIPNYSSVAVGAPDGTVDSSGASSLSGQGVPSTRAGSEGEAKSIVLSYGSVPDNVQVRGIISGDVTTNLSAQGGSSTDAASGASVNDAVLKHGYAPVEAQGGGVGSGITSSLKGRGPSTSPAGNGGSLNEAVLNNESVSQLSPTGNIGSLEEQNVSPKATGDAVNANDEGNPVVPVSSSAQEASSPVRQSDVKSTPAPSQGFGQNSNNPANSAFQFDVFSKEAAPEGVLLSISVQPNSARDESHATATPGRTVETTPTPEGSSVTYESDQDVSIVRGTSTGFQSQRLQNPSFSRTGTYSVLGGTKGRTGTPVKIVRGPVANAGNVQGFNSILNARDDSGSQVSNEAGNLRRVKVVKLVKFDRDQPGDLPKKENVDDCKDKGAAHAELLPPNSEATPVIATTPEKFENIISAVPDPSNRQPGELSNTDSGKDTNQKSTLNDGTSTVEENRSAAIEEIISFLKNRGTKADTDESSSGKLSTLNEDVRRGNLGGFTNSAASGRLQGQSILSDEPTNYGQRTTGSTAVTSLRAPGDTLGNAGFNKDARTAAEEELLTFLRNHGPSTAISLGGYQPSAHISGGLTTDGRQPLTSTTLQAYPGNDGQQPSVTNQGQPSLNNLPTSPELAVSVEGNTAVTGGTTAGETFSLAEQSGSEIGESGGETLQQGSQKVLEGKKGQVGKGYTITSISVLTSDSPISDTKEGTTDEINVSVRPINPGQESTLATTGGSSLDKGIQLVDTTTGVSSSEALAPSHGVKSESNGLKKSDVTGLNVETTSPISNAREGTTGEINVFVKPIISGQDTTLTTFGGSSLDKGIELVDTTTGVSSSEALEPSHGVKSESNGFMTSDVTGLNVETTSPISDAKEGTTGEINVFVRPIISGQDSTLTTIKGSSLDKKIDLVDTTTGVSSSEALAPSHGIKSESNGLSTFDDTGSNIEMASPISDVKKGSTGEINEFFRPINPGQESTSTTIGGSSLDKGIQPTGVSSTEALAPAPVVTPESSDLRTSDVTGSNVETTSPINNVKKASTGEIGEFVRPINPGQGSTITNIGGSSLDKKTQPLDITTGVSSDEALAPSPVVKPVSSGLRTPDVTGSGFEATSSVENTDSLAQPQEKKQPVNELVGDSHLGTGKLSTEAVNVDASIEQQPIDVSGILKPVVYNPAVHTNARIDVSGIATSAVVPEEHSSKTDEFITTDMKGTGHLADVNVGGNIGDKSVESAQEERNGILSNGGAKAVSADTSEEGSEGLTPNEKESSGYSKGVGTVFIADLGTHEEHTIGSAGDTASHTSSVRVPEGVKDTDVGASPGVVPSVVTTGVDEAFGLRNEVYNGGTAPGVADGENLKQDRPDYVSEQALPNSGTVTKTTEIIDTKETNGAFPVEQGEVTQTATPLDNTVTPSYPDSGEKLIVVPSATPSPPVAVTTQSHTTTTEEDDRELGGADKPSSSKSSSKDQTEKSILTVINTMLSATPDTPSTEQKEKNSESLLPIDAKQDSQSASFAAPKSGTLSPENISTRTEAVPEPDVRVEGLIWPVRSHSAAPSSAPTDVKSSVEEESEGASRTTPDGFFSVPTKKDRTSDLSDGSSAQTETNGAPLVIDSVNQQSLVSGIEGTIPSTTQGLDVGKDTITNSLRGSSPLVTTQIQGFAGAPLSDQHYVVGQVPTTNKPALPTLAITSLSKSQDLEPNDRSAQEGKVTDSGPGILNTVTLSAQGPTVQVKQDRITHIPNDQEYSTEPGPTKDHSQGAVSFTPGAFDQTRDNSRPIPEGPTQPPQLNANAGTTTQDTPLQVAPGGDISNVLRFDIGTSVLQESIDKDKTVTENTDVPSGGRTSLPLPPTLVGGTEPFSKVTQEADSFESTRTQTSLQGTTSPEYITTPIALKPTVGDSVPSTIGATGVVTAAEPGTQPLRGEAPVSAVQEKTVTQPVASGNVGADIELLPAVTPVEPKPAVNYVETTQVTTSSDASTAIGAQPNSPDVSGVAENTPGLTENVGDVKGVVPPTDVAGAIPASEGGAEPAKSESPISVVQEKTDVQLVAPGITGAPLALHPSVLTTETEPVTKSGETAQIGTGSAVQTPNGALPDSAPMPTVGENIPDLPGKVGDVSITVSTIGADSVGPLEESGNNQLKKDTPSDQVSAPNKKIDETTATLRPATVISTEGGASLTGKVSELQPPKESVAGLLYHGVVPGAIGTLIAGPNHSDQFGHFKEVPPTESSKHNLTPVTLTPTTSTLPVGNEIKGSTTPGSVTSSVSSGTILSGGRPENTPQSTPFIVKGNTPDVGVRKGAPLVVQSPAQGSILNLRGPYTTGLFLSNRPQSVAPASSPARLSPLAPRSRPQSFHSTSSHTHQPHTRVFFSPPAPSKKQNAQGPSPPVSPYFVNIRHDKVEVEEIKDTHLSFLPKNKVPAEILVPHNLSPLPAQNIKQSNGRGSVAAPGRNQQVSPLSAHNFLSQRANKFFAPPSYTPAFSSSFNLAPGYKSPVTQIVLNPDVGSSGYQLGLYVPRSLPATGSEKRQGVYEVKSFVPGASASFPGRPGLTATSYVPDAVTSARGGQVFRVTSVSSPQYARSQAKPASVQQPQVASSVPGGLHQAQGQVLYTPTQYPRLGLYAPDQGHPQSGAAVFAQQGLVDPQQPVYKLAPVAPQPQALGHDGYPILGLHSASAAHPQGHQYFPGTRVVPVPPGLTRFQARSVAAGQRFTPSFHQQPLTFYDVPKKVPGAAAFQHGSPGAVQFRVPVQVSSSNFQRRVGKHGGERFQPVVRRHNVPLESRQSFTFRQPVVVARPGASTFPPAPARIVVAPKK